jgi:hypothetical protein
MPEESVLEKEYPEQQEQESSGDVSENASEEEKPYEEEVVSQEEDLLGLLLDDGEGQPERELPEKRLARFFAAFLGPMGMIVAMAIHLMHSASYDEILKSSMIALGVFAVIGYIAGLIVEYCVEESVEEIVAEVVLAEPEKEDSSTEVPDEEETMVSPQ